MFEIPYRLPNREDWALVCLLLEHQTRSDWRTPLTTLIYAVLYWEWQLRQWESQPKPRGEFVLRPILPVVLHTGSRPWGSVKTLRDLVLEPVEFRQFLPDWKPLFWEVAGHSTDELLHSHDSFLQVLALFRVEAQAEAEQTFRAAVEQLGPLHDSNVVRWRDLLKFMLGWAYHRRPAQERPGWQALAEQIQADEQRKREAKHMGFTIADAIRQEGKEEGMAKGMAKGKIEGKIEGKLETLFRLGRRKWGEPDAATLQTMQSICDGERLDRMSDAIIDAKSWPELLSVQ